MKRHISGSGRALIRYGKTPEEAFTAFEKLAEASVNSELADKALMEAAFIRKNQNRMEEALTILKKFILSHPAFSLQAECNVGDRLGKFSERRHEVTAVEYFKPLTESRRTRRSRPSTGTAAPFPRPAMSRAPRLPSPISWRNIPWDSMPSGTGKKQI